MRAPACWLIAERVSEPEPGMQEKKLPPRFASASDRHCWLRSSRWRVTAAMALAIEIASSRPSSAMASALEARSWIQAKSKRGSAGRGSRVGMSPTTLTPCSSSRSHAVAAAIATTVIRNSGSSGQPNSRLIRRSTSTSAIEANPIHSVGPWIAPPSVSERQKRTAKWACTSPTADWPSRFLSWSSTSSTLAPSVKPTMTECEM